MINSTTIDLFTRIVRVQRTPLEIKINNKHLCLFLLMESFQFAGVGLMGTFRSEFLHQNTDSPFMQVRVFGIEDAQYFLRFHREALFLILTTVGETLFGKKHACKFIAQVNGIGEIVSNDYIK